MGLSPPVRGNPWFSPQSFRRQSWRNGSIPACAGEPGAGGVAVSVREVYPRLCGGTGWGCAVARCPAGLSPPVRGNHALPHPGNPGAGSIPACAGEPMERRLGAAACWVYPRLCGGTLPPTPPQNSESGLSPPVRGNLCTDTGRQAGRGSIPACAGEPPSHSRIPSLNRVYPRLCGGTDLPRSQPAAPAGLSPPVRGNLCQLRRNPAAARSIPACAGEPLGSGSRSSPGRVYPRLCGGTVGVNPMHNPRRGLSPPVRGNRIRDCQIPIRRRSIPACAGEPSIGIAGI